MADTLKASTTLGRRLGLVVVVEPDRPEVGLAPLGLEVGLLPADGVGVDGEPVATPTAGG